MSRTMSSVAINLDGTEALLLPERAVFLGSARALVVADVHERRSESSRPDEEALDRLGRAAMRAGARVIVVLGDLTRELDELDEAELERVERFRERIALPIRLVARHAQSMVGRTLPPEWRVDAVGARFALGGVRFAYEPPVVEQALAAHWTLAVSPESFRSVPHERSDTPAFVVDRARRILVLPAFSRFAPGVRFASRAGVEVFTVEDSTVIDPQGQGVA